VYTKKKQAKGKEGVKAKGGEVSDQRTQPFLGVFGVPPCSEEKRSLEEEEVIRETKRKVN